MPDRRPVRALRSLYFDCDSTLSTIEGIDELAALRGAAVREEVARATERAMTGELPLASVYGERLRLIAPTRDECSALGAQYLATAVPEAAATVAALASLGKRVSIVSGGLRPAIVPFAEALGIAAHQVFAVDVRFAPDGSYAGYDAASPLARNGGKLDVLAARPAAERPIGIVGDGITDLEASAGVERMIGFGGVARRAIVEDGADAYCAERRLGAVLALMLTEAEQAVLAADPRFAGLLRGGSPA